MSLCYDFQKWTMITTFAILIVCLVGMVNLVHGQTFVNPLDTLVEGAINYCYEHADRPNPIQDLIDKGFLPEQFTGYDCNAVIEHVNKIAENEKLKTRYTSLFELYRISVETRQDLDKLKEKVWGKQQQENKDQKEEKNN